MISVTSVQLSAWLSAFIWPFFRILALVSSAPILGNPSVPLRVKIGLALVLTLVLSPILGSMPAVEPGSAIGLLILAQQVVIGVAIGFIMRIIFTAVEMAGNIAGMQMGLGFATFFDPQNASQSPVVAQLLGLLATLLFLALNGHLYMIELLAQSFQALPVSLKPFSAAGWRALAGWGGEIFLAGLLLSMPIMAALLVTNLALGIMTRAAPQLNVFSVGFPITLAAGFVVLSIAFPYFVPLFDRLLHDALQMAMQVLRLANPTEP
ncbi:flagellar biosynthetic protein FliR [Sulfuricella denitrificans skB26]|uniref:Flagellar biosynthetic protein FliR n=1 Tax=Sulfuricella denitrificans (strain DSM 22764 / NBRC 105220 / skB26) TaxID=1163617 RepID=S6ABW6_SULDS|nr:flagellar biosynthetic protein FliR [Sulfuricella denitrificans]BAN35068.1 flagellar biosynthetic protein FliR [Sulfuricella denitrificans skB26]